MDMKAVKSSNISHIGYNSESKNLKIRFTTGDEYIYLEVPDTIPEDMLKSESIGKFFNKNVKNSYNFLKVK